MAKGKHAPAPGAVRDNKIIHPNSRKANQMRKKEVRKNKLTTQIKGGGVKLQAIGDKIMWFKDNLQFCLNENEKMNAKVMLAIAEAYLSRFEEELEQIKLKNSIGGNKKNKRRQHESRIDVIEHTLKTENDEFQGCGLEMPDLLDEENLLEFNSWQGELRLVQNIKLKRFRKDELNKLAQEIPDDPEENKDNEQVEEEMET